MGKKKLKKSDETLEQPETKGLDQPDGKTPPQTNGQSPNAEIVQPDRLADLLDFSPVDTAQIDPDAVDVTKVKWQGTPPQPLSQTARTPPDKSAKGQAKTPSQRREKPGKTSPSKKDQSHDDDSSDDADSVNIPSEIGVLALRNAVVFPGTVMPLAVGRARSRRLLADVLADRKAGRPGEKMIGLLTQRDPAIDEPAFRDLYPVGTICSILKMIKQPDGQNSIVVHGMIRFRVKKWLGQEPYLHARIEVLQPEAPRTKNLEALVTTVRHSAQRMVQLSPNIPDEVNVVLTNIEDPSALADFLAANLSIPSERKQELLETLNITDRLKTLSHILAEQIEVLEMSAKIQQRVSSSIDKTQREYYLQEQLKAIQTELGVADQRSMEVEELREAISEANMPESIELEAHRELDRLAQIPTASPEYSVVRNYIEWLCELPWAQATQDKLNIPSARRILNRDHYDLAKVKKRILEFLAVRKLNPTGRSPILCFAGPPGVGKTSLGQSIARAMGRKFIRVSLGGIRDEADIRGHRRTYIGALPGRIIQELRKCGSHNPVFMLDELDKIGQDFRGDPASALLEVLDPEQNSTFTDHFIDQPFDLSRVLFIGTVNYMQPVPPALRDRMEVLELPGYTAREKLQIAKKYLLPRQLKENGLTPSQCNIKDEALTTLIDSYTREAGVRELERQIAALCRAVAAQVAAGERKSAVIAAKRVAQILGAPRYESELALRTSVPGVATGLAYTPVGGQILFVEATIAPGTGKLILTGQLGEVMKESAQAALSVLKSQAVAQAKKRGKPGPLAPLGQQLLDGDFLAKQDVHIHVPEGAIPKDGPSAGVAMYTALASLMLEKPIRYDVAMTGEITLRGLVLPIGGLKEKLLAAKRAGIKTVVLPQRNKKDLEEVPKDVTRSLQCRFVENLDQVLKAALT